MNWTPCHFLHYSPKKILLLFFRVVKYFLNIWPQSYREISVWTFSSKTTRCQCHYRIDKLNNFSFYLFWWCCTTHRAGVCCLLQCPGAAPCSCWARTPHPAYLCPGTAGHKTHRNCNSTVLHKHCEREREKKAAVITTTKNMTTTRILHYTLCIVTAEDRYKLKLQHYNVWMKGVLSSCHSQRRSHSSQHYRTPHPCTPLHCCLSAQGSIPSPARRPLELRSSD